MDADEGVEASPANAPGADGTGTPKPGAPPAPRRSLLKRLAVIAAVFTVAAAAAVLPSWPGSVRDGERLSVDRMRALLFPGSVRAPDPAMLADEARLAAASASSLAAFLHPQHIGALEDDAALRIGTQIVRSALREHRDPVHLLASLLPSPSDTIAMLARDRDRDDFEESSALPGAAGDHYGAIVERVPFMRPLRSTWEAFMAGARAELAAVGRVVDPVKTDRSAAEYKGGVTLPRLSSRPRERDFAYSHTYALDIFFTDSEEGVFGGGETGPTVFSASPGIVVTAASDWNGGAGIENYRSGGISPNAGNGVIVYDPVSRRFFLYFHFKDVSVAAGQAILEGQPLGRGGDTGANARIPGHGQHLHLEIFDAKSRRFLRNSEIADLVF